MFKILLQRLSDALPPVPTSRSLTRVALIPPCPSFRFVPSMGQTDADGRTEANRSIYYVMFEDFVRVRGARPLPTVAVAFAQGWVTLHLQEGISPLLPEFWRGGQEILS